MKSLPLIFLILLLPEIGASAQTRKTYKSVTVAFYNLENLFDYEDDPFTYDDDRTPDGKDHWTQEDYRKKIENMARVISQIGVEETGAPPAIIGVCEIENRTVLEDLLKDSALADKSYQIIHFDSPDRRGIDVAFIYLKPIFMPTHYKPIALKLFREDDSRERIYTRDQLVVSGMLDGEPVHFIVNHWPSRSGGEPASRMKRIKAAALNKRIIDSLFSIDPYAKIISMGDLNDDPTSPSVQKVLKPIKNSTNPGIKQLFNPMESLFKTGNGTLAWRDGWNLFDQMIISSELLKKDYSSYRFFKAGIFNKSYLSTRSGRFKGYPFRSHSNGKFTGGFSDHFPVYLLLIKETDR